jgi:hypothetical protein
MSTKAKKAPKKPKASKLVHKNWFDLLADPLMLKIISYIPVPKTTNKHKTYKDWFVVYMSWAYTCKGNYNFYRNHGSSAIPDHIRSHMYKRVYTDSYPNDAIVRTRLTRNGSYFEAQMSISSSNYNACCICKLSCGVDHCSSYTTSDDKMCSACRQRFFVNFGVLKKILRTQGLDFMKPGNYIDPDISIGHANVLIKNEYNRSLDDICYELRGMSFLHTMATLTFNK